MIKKIRSHFAAIAALFKRAEKYTYEGQTFDSPKKFQKGVDAKASATVAAITALPKPLTQKKLVFAIPSSSALIKESNKRFLAVHGSQPVKLAKEIVENLSISNFKSLKVFFDAIKKKNIYASVKFVQMGSMAGTFAASADTDALYMTEASAGSAQWNYASLKHGEEIFTYDGSCESMEGKVMAFVDAAQALAVRD